MNHPNLGTVDEMNKRIDSRKQQVVDAWQKKYNTQAQILRWPQELKDDFIRFVEPLRPIEAKVSFPMKKAVLTSVMRLRYKNYIKAELPKLALEIGSRWRPQKSRAMGGRTTQPTDDTTPLIVNWNPANQSEIETNHFDWPMTNPNVLESLYAQENLWVLSSF